MADIPAAHWEYGIGDIDQRVSPNLDYEGYEDRFDFGFDEYIKFCNAIGSDPQLTVNYANGSPEEAANWVEYSNGDTNTTYGKLRARNGNIEPYNVKIWEIGNEQYNDPANMAKRFLTYYKAMKAKDPTIRTIIDGTVWSGDDYIKTIFGVVGDTLDIYGWHHGMGSSTKCATERGYHLLYLTGAIQWGESVHNNITNYLLANNYYPKIQQGITEWWCQNIYGWVNDRRTWGIETALVESIWMNVILRSPETFVLANRTTFVESGIIMARYDSVSNRRVIFGGGPYYSSLLYRNHCGSCSFPLTVTSPTFDVPEDDSVKWTPKNVPWIDAVVTASADSVFIFIVNKNDSSDIAVNISGLPYNNNDSYNVYSLSSSNYSDINTPEAPYKVTPRTKNAFYDGTYTAPVNSVSILAFPIKNIIGVLDNVDKSNPTINPSPFSSQINIQLNDEYSNGSKIEICNLLGARIYSAIIKDGEKSLTIDSENFTEGAYFITIRSGSNKVFHKIIVK